MPAALRHIAIPALSRQGPQAGGRPAPLMGAPQNNVDWASVIVAIATRQDREAFEKVFLHFAPRVKAMLIKLGTTAELADDLAQEAMLAVWRKADKFDPSTSAVAAWIYTIARNLRIDAIRKVRPSTTLAEVPHEAWEDDAPRPDEIVQARDDFARVRRALAALPLDQADAIRSAYYLDMSQAETASAMDTPLGTVKSRVRLALKRLRALMDDDNAS
jgi:RNA polymerase sigma-70 factor (ECF subfamily)